VFAWSIGPEGPDLEDATSASDVGLAGVEGRVFVEWVLLMRPGELGLARREAVNMKIADIMKRDVEICGPDDNVATAASRMWDGDLGCIPVVAENGQVMGMVTDRDICMAALTRGRPLQEIPVTAAMSKEIFSCPPDATLIEAEEIMRAGQVRRLPVIDSDSCLVGIVSLGDLAHLAGHQIGRKNRDVSAQEVVATLAAVCEPRRGPVGRFQIQRPKRARPPSTSAEH
jgi:CBS-domain-containing membrane protein